MHPDIGWPLITNEIRGNKVSNTFGNVRRTRSGKRRVHQGWDFATPVGYRCYAIADCEVVSVKNYGAYGLRILLKFRFDYNADGNKDTLYAFYAHMGRSDVVPGQKVRRGQQIGLSGESGNARGMAKSQQHLHFEIRTRRFVGLGLGGRISPMAVFRHCPLDGPVTEEGPFIKLTKK